MQNSLILSLISASEYDMEEPSKDVISIISHAVQERLKTLVEKLGVIAEHRLDLLKVRKDLILDLFLNDSFKL